MLQLIFVLSRVFKQNAVTAVRATFLKTVNSSRFSNKLEKTVGLFFLIWKNLIIKFATD